MVGSVSAASSMHLLILTSSCMKISCQQELELSWKNFYIGFLILIRLPRFSIANVDSDFCISYYNNISINSRRCSLNCGHVVTNVTSDFRTFSFTCLSFQHKYAGMVERL